MAWIESHQSLGQHPKTKKLARLLGASVPQVVGHLHLLWWWAFDYAQDGDLSRYSAEDIADAVLWEGSATLLLTALLDARFLDQPDGNPRIHDWDQYGGKLLAKRRADSARQRSTPVPMEVRRKSDGNPTEVLRKSQVEDIEDIDNIEKRREEESAAAPAPPNGRRPKKAAFIPLSEEERQKLLTDFPGSEEQIELALAHEAHWKYPTGQYLYVRNWLKRPAIGGQPRPEPSRGIEFVNDMPKPRGITVPDMGFRDDEGRA